MCYKKVYNTSPPQYLIYHVLVKQTKTIIEIVTHMCLIMFICEVREVRYNSEGEVNMELKFPRSTCNFFISVKLLDTRKGNSF